MIFNRLIWFYKLIHNRGFKQALKKLSRELYQKKEWVILKLPAEKPLVELTIQTGVTINLMTIERTDVFDKLSQHWPVDFPDYDKPALINEFKTRISKGTQGYYLAEEKPIGGMWLAPREDNLKGTPFELKNSDRIVKNIFISTEKSGRGLAKILVNESIKEHRIKHQGCIYALVYPDRIPSIKTFLNLGFNNLGTIKSVTFLFKSKRSFTKKV